MKKLFTLTLCTILAASSTLPVSAAIITRTKEPTTIKTNVQISNPFVDCKTLEEAGEIAGFSITAPKTLLKQYTNRSISAIKNDLIQITYTDEGENQTIQVRKSEGTDDISGDYNHYTKINHWSCKNYSIQTKGDNHKIYVATWTTKSKNPDTYSITSTQGLSKYALRTLINQFN